MRKVIVVLLVAAVLTALALSSASARLDVALDSYSVFGRPGDILVVSGTIWNASPHSVILDYPGCSSSGPICASYGPYADNYYKRSLAPDEAWSGSILAVWIDQSAPIGFASTEEFSIQCYSAETDEWDVGEVFYNVNVVPEPSSLMALACGVTGIGGMLLRRRRSR